MGKSEENQTIKKAHKAADDESKHKNKPSFDAGTFEATDNDGGSRHSKWREFFGQLCEYKAQFGDCLVPQNFAAKNKLGRWVSKQRSNYRDRKNKEIKPTDMVAEHIRALNAIGFDWGTTQTDWSVRFEQLCEFKVQLGHCLVPREYSSNPKLALWVKKERRNYMLRKEGKTSPMTVERIRAFESIDFEWEPSNGSWNERFEQLREFKVQFGHCHVPNLYAANPKLVRWVITQCKIYRGYQRGNTSRMTAERIRDLESIGFKWKRNSVPWNKKSVV